MRMQFKNILFLFLISTYLIGCSFVPNELKTAEQLIETNPDSALHILQHISPENYNTNESRALYGLLIIQTLDKKQLPLKPDSLLNFSIEYYQKHPTVNRLASCYLYKGRSYKYAFQYEKAMDFYLKALDAVTDKNDFLLVGRINYDMGDIYLYQKDYQLARKKYQEAYNYFVKTQNINFAHYSQINIGESYCRAKLYDKALPYFMKIYKESRDSIVLGEVIQSIGVNYYNALKYDSALFYLKKAVKFPCIKNAKPIRYYYLADLLFDMNKYDSAYYYANASLNYQPDIITQRECYRILVNSSNLKGDLYHLKLFMAGYQNCVDSIRKIDAQTKGSYIETFHNGNKEMAGTRLKMEYLYIVLFLVIIIALAVYSVIHRRNMKERARQDELHILQNAEKHKETLFNHRHALQMKIKERKSIQMAERIQAGPKEKLMMDRKIYEELLHVNDTQYFYEEMNSLLNNLVNKIKEQYPAVNTREIYWCCLYLLHVPNTDMYMLLDVNVDSLKKLKQRLLPKFNLSGIPELENFLLNLLSE